MKNNEKNKSNFLGIKNIVSDINELPKKYKIMLLIIGIFSIFLSFFDFNHFIDKNNYPSFFSIINTLNSNKDFLSFMPKWLDASFYSLSGLASFTSVLCVFLISFGKISNYFWGVINAIAFGLFSLDFGYAGDAQINILFYLPMQFIGWIFWVKNKSDNDNKLNIRTSNTYFYSIVGVLSCIPLTIVFYYEIPWLYNLVFKVSYSYSNAAQWLPRTLDSLTNAIAIVAMVMMVLRFKENWILWLIANVINFAMFCGLNTIGSENPVQISVNQLIQLGFLTFNSFVGYIQWKKSSKSQVFNKDNIKK